MTSELHSFSKGDPGNAPVLCIHGLLGSSRNLYRLAQAIGDAGFHSIAYDQRGHGHSGRAKNYSLNALAKDALEALDARGVNRAHLVGHSLGARVALAAAALEPDRALSVVMLDAGTRLSAGAARAIRGVIDPLPESFPSRAEARRFLAARFEASMQQFLLSNLRERAGAFEWMFDLAGIRGSLLKELDSDQSDAWKGLRCPALLVRGERSEHFGQGEFEKMLGASPLSRGLTVANAGHWLHVDNFEDTSSAVLEFLKSVKG